jgi:broad specificity phosphatase PhoE
MSFVNNTSATPGHLPASSIPSVIMDHYRHSLRADGDPDEAVQATVIRKYDTPLSPAGIARIYETEVVPTQYIWCSPLWRCIETAVEIQKRNGGVIIIDAGLGEVMHPKVLKCDLKEFSVQDDTEVRKLTELFIRLDTPFPEEETRGIDGSADERYRASLVRIGEWCLKRKVPRITIVSHGDSLGSLAAMCKKELYAIEEFGRITAVYNSGFAGHVGKWTYISSNNALVMDI